MALPIIDVPTFELEIPGIDKKFKFRPFLVKENKILTLAGASEDVQEMFSACCQIITNCSYGKVDCSKLAMYQIQWLFLQLRSKSIGTTQSFTLKCGNCQDSINYEMEIDAFEIIGNKDRTQLKLEINETVGMLIKYPTAELQMKLEELDDTEILIKCIDHIYDGDGIVKPEDETKEEMIEFIDNLPIELIEKASSFFAELPSLAHKVEYTCQECETKNEIVINGYDNFFG